MSDITIKAHDGGTFTGYLALPKSGRGPGMIVIQEIFGVNKNMRDLCDNLASQGYIALCPDLFWRQEPGVQITDRSEAEWAKAMKLFQGFDVDKGVDDLKTALATLRKHPACAGPVGTVGFCLGGKLAYLMATRSDADANVSYYGVGIQDMLDESKTIRKPLLMHIAEKDKFVPIAAQKAIADKLRAHSQVTIHSYAGMDHAFTRVGGDHYNAEAAKLAHQRTADFLKMHLRKS